MLYRSDRYGNQISQLGYGCMRFTRKGTVIDFDKAERELMLAIENGINYLFWEDETRITQHLPFDPLINPDQMELLKKEDHGIQFSHTIEEQIGGQLEAGFTLLALYEDTNGSGRLHELGIPSFIATLSEKKGSDL